MLELIKTARVVGFRRMLQLQRASRLAWPGMISGFYTTRVMQTLFNVGFFDELLARGEVNMESFATSNDLDVDILKSLCDSLYSLRILKKAGSNYRLDSKGRVLAETAKGWFDGVYGYEGVMHDLEALLRKEKEYGKNVWRRPDFVAKGSGEIEKWIYFPLANDSIAASGFKKVLDLGCGDATFLRNLCEHNLEVTGYGIDIAPEAIEEGKSKVKEAGLQERIHLFVEDVSRLERVSEPLRKIDACITFFVLHELLFNGRECVLELLRGFRTLFPGIPLIVFEAIRPSPDEMRRKPGMAIQYYLHHDLSRQKPVGRKEWSALFAEAGFQTIDERYLSFARTSIFTLR